MSTMSAPTDRTWARLASWVVLGISSLTGSQSCGQAPDFNRDVRPILADKCFACHGPDAGSREADLRLDRRAAAKRVLGADAPRDSQLIARIRSADPDVRMPPPEAPKQLSDAERKTLEAWIAAGAPYAEHWAFVLPNAPVPPTGSAWAESPLDAFIERSLIEIGLEPSPPADALTLVRRAYLDVLGLPPTPAEADYWASRLAESERAWPALVDRLLTSPHYGERWARVWLDAARYADSDGFEKDKPRFVWAYRDWVIRAFNRDQPYDAFVIEQIAGDMLENATEDQIIATGFLRNSMINEEGGVDPEQFRMEAMFDRMDAIGKSVLGLTIQCAQCHSHKFDPISQREYYQMFAFLNDCHEANVAAYSLLQREQRDSVLRGVRELEDSLRKDTPDWRERMAAWEREVAERPSTPWTVLRPKEDTSGGQKHYVLEDASVLAQGYAPTRHETSFETQTSQQRITAFRLELMNDPNLPRGGPGRSIHGLCALTEFKATLQPLDGSEKPVQAEFVSATASVNPPETPLDAIFNDRSKKRRVTGPVEFALDRKDETAWGIDRGPGRSNIPEQAVFVLKEPIEHASGWKVTLRVRQMHGGWNSDDNQNNNLGRFRFACTDSDSPQAEAIPQRVREALRQPLDQRDAASNAAAFSYWRTLVPEFAETNEAIEELWRQHPDGTTQLVLQQRPSPRPTAVLVRGDFLKPAEPVAPGAPQFLHPIRHEAERASRLEFAQWLVSRESPTTARAWVNRVWQEYFGTGLVETSEDLGTQSPPPVNRDALDWLATRFMDDGWSTKWLQRQILLSQAYRQASRRTDENRRADPSGRWLSRYPRRRVHAETVRDVALASSGLLDCRVGGPSVFPPAPAFLFKPPASYGPKTWNQSQGGDLYRRALYTFRFRSAPYPMLQTFDAPPGETACVRRPQSNTPLQPLVTLNHETFMQAARNLASESFRHAPLAADSARIAWMFRRCVTRPPSKAELGVLSKLLADQLRHFAENAEDAKALIADETISASGERAAWTVVARVLLNLDETISHP